MPLVAFSLYQHSFTANLKSHTRTACLSLLLLVVREFGASRDPDLGDQNQGKVCKVHPIVTVTSVPSCLRFIFPLT